MKHTFFFVLFGLFVFAPAFAAEPVGEIDDSSYESLYSTAQRYELRRASGGWNNLLSFPDETLNAITKFNQLDLLDKDIAAFQEAVAKISNDQPSTLDYARSFAEKIVEPLFQAGYIDEGVAFLKKMLPPQSEAEGMLAIGYVSDALLEQKRFDLAWQLAKSGPVNYGVSRNIYDYIRRLMVKTQTRRSIYGNAPVQYPFVKNEEDREIFKKEANRAFEYLLELPQPADAPEGARQWIIALTLIALGRYDQAFELYDPVEDKRKRLDIFDMIQKEHSSLAKFDEVEQWYEKLCELYGEDETRQARNHYHTYLSLDAVNKYFDNTLSPKRASGLSVSELMTHLMSNILKFNVETDFRYNSKELLERLLKEHKEPFNEPNPAPSYFETRNGQRVRRVHRFHENIIKAQLNLDLVEDALETFRQFQYAFQAVESLADISFYAAKNKSPEEVERIEAEAIKVFMAFPETSEASNLYFLITCYAQTATRLMNDGEAEKGFQYLKKAIGKAEDAALHDPTEKPLYPDSFTYMGILCFSYMGIVCGELAIHGYIDEALQISRQFEDRLPMPGLYLFIAEKFAVGEQEKAKAALRKAFELFSQIEKLPPTKYRIYETYHTRMAALAVTLGEKEWFYKIMDAALNVTESRQRTNLLTVFTRQLALYGDKDHPLHAELEAEAVKIPERNDYGFSSYPRNGYPHLLTVCGVNKAILGYHVNARRLLKRAMEVEYAASIRDRHHGMWEIAPAIIEARSYEKSVTGIK